VPNALSMKIQDLAAAILNFEKKVNIGKDISTNWWTDAASQQ